MPDLFFPILWIVLLIILVAFLASNIVIVPQAKAYIVERLGTYQGTWGTGLHFKLPLFERIARKVTLKEQVVDFPPQPVITKDNVTMQIDTVVYFQITDSKLFTYAIENPMAAIENLTATTLRNIIGDLELDQTLTSRDIINTKMRSLLDEATDDWGIKVNRVELKNIIPPAAIKESMEKQMRAERERREAILVAEGKKQSAILVAEGEKESMVLRAEATRLSKIKEAEGEAEALLAVQKALADSLRLLNEAAPSDAVLRIKALEAFSSVADGKATKIIIPSEIQGLAGLATAFKESIVDSNIKS
ncbi:SPFH domain-containing protein [Intestinibacillus sp. Marseille-P6563]|uniref:SPFH domain-containing protein n=1 Tax=Intestinibacillus sp. Marseille-P6563 TaxID=2364792 RepID=UPI000F04C802|nr:SPFH domain-containing protein [Intestinibacillus sp. Marseille-P6563]